MKTLDERLAARARGKEPSPIRELQRYLAVDGMISLGGGYPNPRTFVFDDVEVRFGDGSRARLQGDALAAASQYGPSPGDPALCSTLVRWHAEKDGVELREDGLVVLNGSQEGLFVAAYLFLDADDSVVVSEPTYPGALAAFKSFSRRFVPVPLDAHGMDTAALEQTLAGMARRGERLPKLIYTIPNGHNPGGVALSLPRRRHMIEIASRFDLLVLEDDPYQLVRLDDSPPPPTLQSLDTEGRVVRLDSFSKIFAPGLRIGYVSGDPELCRQFELFKQSSNLHVSSFVQALLRCYLCGCESAGAGFETFRAHIRRSCALYRANRDAMIEAARAYLPPGVRFNVPGEGMFIWFELPDGCDAGRMVAQYSAALKVLLVPGPAFSSTGGLRSCMRASYSTASPDQIREGMRRFGEMIRREVRR